MHAEPIFVEARDGARERLAATVAALRRPESYPYAVTEVGSIETHMSWVFLTDRHAFKLKKPIRTQWLDHRSLEARRRACETELRLNRRLAPDVYLAVVPLVQTAAGLRLEEQGPARDWLVKMRRLPRVRMLDALVRKGAVAPRSIDELADTLASFYLRAERVPFARRDYLGRLTKDIAAKSTTLRQPRYGLEPRALDAVLEAQQRWLDRHGDTLAVRGAAVLDAHGDLRPEHVCLEDPPVVIDCLEFSRALRLLDPVSELSFLGLECRRLGAPWIGEQLIRRYAERTGDRPPAELVPFYQRYHALVRAAVAVWHLDDGALSRTNSWTERGQLYLELAQRLG